VIDEKDWEILELIQRDGRATYGDIGRHVGLAASSVHDRVRKLEQKGVIKGFGPRIDPGKLGLGLLALVSVQTKDSCSSVAEHVRGWREIEECHGVAGEDCTILKVRTADAESLHDLLERLRAVPGVERTRSTIVLKTYWDQNEIRRPDEADVNGLKAVR
jgi:Lrp/AsnC family leucine-responsive transcriptional regulator